MSKHITGHTGLLCLLGSPVAHSVSPEMHNEACDQLGLDYTYLAFDVPEEKMPQAVEGLRTMGARGWNITMPGKNIMCKLADKVSPASEISGACNTIVNDNGVLTAYTTDGVGFMKSGRRERRGYHRKEDDPARSRRSGDSHSCTGCSGWCSKRSMYSMSEMRSSRGQKRSWQS